MSADLLIDAQAVSVSYGAVEALRGCDLRIVVVTHDHQVAAHFDRLVFLRDGTVVDQAMAVR